MIEPQPNVADTRPSHRWGRLASWTPHPARVLHKGAPLPKDKNWEDAWRPCLAYGADSLITAAARPVTGIFIGARDQWAANEGQAGKRRALKTAEGAAMGLGKGAVGCVVSAAGACAFLTSGVFLGGVAAFSKVSGKKDKSQSAVPAPAVVAARRAPTRRFCAAPPPTRH